MIYAVFAPIIFALFILITHRFIKKIHLGYITLFVPLIIFIYFSQFIQSNFKPITQSYEWIPSLQINIDFYLDGLSLLFVLLISGIGTLVVFYSIFYLSKSEKLNHFYFYLMLFMTAMLGTVLSDNVFVLYTFWEMTSISSFLLIGFWHMRERSRYGALKSMLITIFGGLSLLGGLIIVSTIAQSTSIREIVSNVDTVVASPFFIFALIFIIIGAFTKSAQFPFHIWLPDAMEAPTPISAYLHSATMVKAGIYLIARFFPLFSAVDSYFIIVTTFGLITLCWGSFMAVRQTDLKAILAYSTISQLGMIMAMLGFGTNLAIFAAVFHILNHATFKGSLFMVAGIIDLQTGTRDIRKLGKLYHFLPISATLAFFGTFSMAGVPLPILNGFYSKEMFFESTLTAFSNSNLQMIIPIVAIIGSIFTFVYSMYLFFGVFIKQNNDIDALPNKPKEAPIGMLISPAILVFGVIIIGLLPNLFNKPFLAHAATSILPSATMDTIQFWHGFNKPFIMSLIVVIVGAVLAYTRKYWQPIYNVIPGELSFNRVYDATLNGLNKRSQKVTNTYMNGSVRTYMSLILGATFVLTFYFMYKTNGFAIDFSDLAQITMLEVTVVIAIIISAIGTIFANRKVMAILIFGITGYSVAILFVIYRAPDLALTQLVIESISLVLFLLCFYHFPELGKRNETKGNIISNLFISIGFGLMMTMLGISSLSSGWFEKISDYFIETSLPIGGGKNIVNVILVDMRGFDTLFEITVLGIAGLAVFALIKLRKDKEAK